MLDNSLVSLRRAAAAVDVIVYCSTPCLDSIGAVAQRHGCRFVDIGNLDPTGRSGYSDFGTDEFNAVVSRKWDAILMTLELGYQTVVFADCDIAFIRDFVPYLSAAASTYACGLQSESVVLWPPEYCTGFMFFTREAMDLLRMMSAVNKENVHRGNDQVIFNEEIRRNPDLIRDVLALPESLFQNGLHYRSHLGPKLAYSVGNLTPLLFHANYVAGLENKKSLLKYVSLWFVDGGAA